MGAARVWMSLVSGASKAKCAVAWSPTTLTMPEPAFLALCKFAKPFARPGPKCNSVAAGRSVMRQ